ncbi:hypothetical protein PspLS_08707 [Pyricularia sp. CBS 133598]|nr:hypothetical protein PspLS_08707 [Pyricularia sp. CBS 133598]
MSTPLQPVSFSQATSVERLDHKTYSVTVSEAFSVGKVSHGGYVASCLLEAARLHLTVRNQSDPLCAQYSFLDKTTPGPAIILVEEVKLGQRLSILHIALYQDNLLTQAPWVAERSSRPNLVAYITCTNIQSQVGLSLPTGFNLQPRPPPVNFGRLLEDGTDGNWCLKPPATPDKPGYRLGHLHNVECYVPIRGQPSKSILDAWFRLRSGERFTNSSLAFMADIFGHVPEQYRAKPGQTPDNASFPSASFNWYPTLALNLEVKKSLTETSVKFLQLRVSAKEIKNGRLDMEMLILDAAGDLVAIANHVTLIVSADRNLESSRINRL